MTTRTVVWIQSAEAELATIWLAAGRSEAVTIGSYEIDRDLRLDAERNGTPLAEGLFVIERPPLRAVFEIKHEDNLVRVVSLSVVKMP
jgi:hypothetical protein